MKRFPTAWAAIGLAMLLPSCATERAPSTEPGPLYFASPGKAVADVNLLLAKRDWATLARGYDVSLTHTDPAELTSGRYFVDETASATEGPTAVARHRQPFAPGSRFTGATPTGDPAELPCIWAVNVLLEIDEGGGLKQRRLDTVNMIQTSRGFQLLPLAPLEPLPSAEPKNAPDWKARGSDDALFYRPELRGRVEREIPAGGMTHVPALVSFIEKQREAALAHPGVRRQGEAGEVYEPSDEELILSLAGDRLFRTVSIAPPGVLAQARPSWPADLPSAVIYPAIRIERIEGSGTGPRHVAHPPTPRSVSLTEP